MAFCPEGGEFEQANIKSSNAWGFAEGGGALKLQFDWYIMHHASVISSSALIHSILSTYLGVTRR